jgi:hypothetical protein
MQRLPIVLAMIYVVTSSSAWAQDDEWTAEQVNFFESKIRPVLADKCYSCHAHDAKNVGGNLLVDTRAGLLQGGDSGPAIEPGQADDSLLLAAIRYEDDDLAMPPKKSGGKLPDAVIADFKKWIEMGAPDPRKAEGVVQEFGADDDAKQWWAFQPMQKPVPPSTMDSSWPKTDIDRFVLNSLESKGLKPVGDAEPLVLLRRIYFDLIGLPPSAKEAQAFLEAWKSAPGSDAQDELYAAVVDRLLASPQFGERWGRYWLDVARYSESSGKDVNILYPQAWRYRDYVIDSFNADVPYDQFIQQQIAGDLLPAKSNDERARHLIATGFLAIGPKSLNEMKARQFALDLADEQIDTVTQSVMGLTVACARCHDHKFDPISQVDYTAIAGIFLSTDTRFGTTGGNGGRNAAELVDLPKGTSDAFLPTLSQSEYDARVKRLDELRTEIRELVAERQRARRSGKPEDDGLNVVRVTTQISMLEAELKNYNEDGSVKALAMGAVDKPSTAPRSSRPGNFREFRRRASGFVSVTNSPLFVRGDVDRPSDLVPRAIPPILPNLESPKIPAGTSGRRELALWMTSPDHPLTARVMANRVWHWLFGAGIVASVDNFGTTGNEPSNPQLLDYLAQKFVADGWSVKKLIREMVLSRTYRLAATYDESCFQADPENALCWRHNSRRLDAEAIRDSMLSAAGMLDLNQPKASLIGRAGDGPLGGPRRMRLTEDNVAKATNNNRSVYLSVARNVEPEVLAVFDFPDAASVQGARQVTNVPSQSLFMLNSDFSAKQAKALANRVMPVESKLEYKPRLETNIIPKQLEQMYWHALGRPPTSSEESAARKLLGRYRSDAITGWTSVARAILASSEFRSID